MSSRLGIITVGQTPRDELVGDFAAACTAAEIHLVGALDGTTDVDRARLSPKPGEYPIRCQLRDGSEVAIGKGELVPRIQGCIDLLELEGIDAIVIGCNSVFSGIQHSVPLLQPGKIANGIVRSISEGLTLGCLVPLPEQVPNALREFEAAGINCVARTASPGQSQQEVIEVTKELVALGADLVYLKCFGFNGAWKRSIANSVRVPVLSPVTLTASAASALLEPV